MGINLPHDQHLVSTWIFYQGKQSVPPKAHPSNSLLIHLLEDLGEQCWD